MKKKDYIIYIKKVTTSVIRVPARNKKEAINIAERFIDDIDESSIDINRIINFNPEFKLRVKPCSTHISAFFIGGKRNDN